MNEWEWQLLEDKPALTQVEVDGITIKLGDRVRLRPRKGGDIFDIALAGQIASVSGIEQDYEGNCHLCVVLDDDPGRDLGLLRQPGHQFFFAPGEVQLLTPGEHELAARAAQIGGHGVQTTGSPRTRPSILIAGIGNIFLGDDGFGVEVVQRLARRATLPAEVRVTDFGIRGFDLAYALQEGYDTTILVDACPRGDQPGTLYVVEPDLDALGSEAAEENFVDAHAMNPMAVLRMVKTTNAVMKRVLLVGCEPATLGGDEGQMGLSEPVAAAVDEAVRMIEALVAKILSGNEISATA